MPSPDADPLWQFALNVYGVEGVAAECIAAQNQHGADVCVLLTAVFAAAEGFLPDQATLAAWDDSVRDWRQTVVRQIRAVRDSLKALGADAEISGLRQAVLAIELQAERLELKQLAAAYAEAKLVSRPEMEPRDRVVHTLARVAGLYGSEAIEMPRLVQAVTFWQR